MQDQTKLFQKLGRNFLYKISSCTTHNWYCTTGFLTNAALLNVYFILQYHLFFVKKKIFSNGYISVNTILECRSLLSKLTFTHTVSCLSRSHEIILVTRGFELVDLNSQLVDLNWNFWISTYAFKLSTHN